LTPFLFHHEWARVIAGNCVVEFQTISLSINFAGEEEGVYGWISVNQAYGTLLQEQENTLGSLDLGGSSMQITFFPKHTSVIEVKCIHLQKIVL
jgi:Golgi nucleoside diphosphatase